LKLDHQLNQLVLAQALQISPFHEHMDSEIALRGKGVGKYVAGKPACPMCKCAVTYPTGAFSATTKNLETDWSPG
jgi:hypothetical protein